MSREPSDDEQFQLLFDASFDDVWRFARRRCGSNSDADDVAAQVFAVVWRRRDDIPADAARLWLFGVARNVLANHHRSGDRARRLELRLLDRSSGAIDQVLPGSIDERGAALLAAIDDLRDDDREVIALRYWDELAVQEIAALLGRSPNAVSLRLHKARRRLAEAIGTNDPSSRRQVAVDFRHGTEDDDELA